MKITKIAARILVIAGVIVLGLGVYRVWDPFAGSRQHAAQQRLYQSWGAPRSLPGKSPAGPQGCQMTSRPRTGQVFAIIQIPAFGASWKFTVIEGTTLAQLGTGPGHITGTAMPGASGNVGIAAHDVTAGNPFLHLADLGPGDDVIITTRGCVTTYAVNRPSFRVLYTDVAVLRPTGREHTLTLVTCWPIQVLYFVPHRTIVSATEVKSVPR